MKNGVLLIFSVNTDINSVEKADTAIRKHRLHRRKFIFRFVYARKPRGRKSLF